MTSGQVAHAAGVNVETLRYYERRGLLPEPPRLESGYRQYGSEAVRTVRFVKRAQELGFSLDEVEALLELAGGGPESCDGAQEVARHRIAELDHRILDLQAMRDSLQRLLDTCHRPRSERVCPLIQAIEADSEPASEAAGRRRTRLALPARIRAAAFRRLLVHGLPVTAAELAAENGIDPAEAEAAFKELDQAGRIELDDNGDIVGSAGLSVVPSRHQLQVGERGFWTWCAWDALGVLGALAATGRVHSRDPFTTEELSIRFTDGVPQPARAVVFRAAFEGYSSVRNEYCPLTNLFQDDGSATSWASVNRVKGTVLSVREAAAEAAPEWKDLVDGMEVSFR